MSDAPAKSRNLKSSIEMGVVALLVVVFMVVSLFAQFIVQDAGRHFHFTWGADPRKSIGIIIAAGLTLVMYSFLYRDNAFFKVAENLYVGVALGYTMIMACWRQALRPDVYETLFYAPTAAAFWNAALHRAMPILLGILLITRLSRKYGWLSRYSYAIMVGWGAGVTIPLTVNSFLFQQLYASVAPFQDAVAPHAAMTAFSGAWFMNIGLPVLGAVVVMVGTVAVLFYFFFSIEHKGAGGAVSWLGILFLMVAFGASFGYTVMGRISLLIGRINFLLNDWLRIST